MEWRDILQQETSRYAATPGGGPPFELMEGIVHAQSAGDPRALSGQRKGLALIHPGSKAYAEYVERYGREPDLWNPADNVGVLALRLDTLQESGLEAAEAGQPAALQDWMIAALGFRGWADNAGLTPTGKAPDEAKAMYDWDGSVRKYMLDNFGRDILFEIDAMYPGAVRRDEGALEIVGNDLQPPDPIDLPGLPSVGNPVSQLTGWLQNVAGRVALFLLGLVAVGLGVWWWSR